MFLGFYLTCWCWQIVEAFSETKRKNRQEEVKTKSGVPSLAKLRCYYISFSSEVNSQWGDGA